jgi:hypothetical protein
LAAFVGISGGVVVEHTHTHTDRPKYRQKDREVNIKCSDLFSFLCDGLVRISGVVRVSGGVVVEHGLERDLVGFPGLQHARLPLRVRAWVVMDVVLESKGDGVRE